MTNFTYFRHDHAVSMKLRDYFAAQAMVGLLNCYHNPKEFTEQVLANQSYEIADAMLKARDA